MSLLKNTCYQGETMETTSVEELDGYIIFACIRKWNFTRGRSEANINVHYCSTFAYWGYNDRVIW